MRGEPSFGESKKVEIVVMDDFLDAGWFIDGGGDGRGRANIEAGELERSGGRTRVNSDVIS